VTRHTATGTFWVASNDDWGNVTNVSELLSAHVKAGAFALKPRSRDAALLTWLEPGRYTVLVSGTDGGTGVALAEVYEVR